MRALEPLHGSGGGVIVRGQSVWTTPAAEQRGRWRGGHALRVMGIGDFAWAGSFVAQLKLANINDERMARPISRPDTPSTSAAELAEWRRLFSEMEAAMDPRIHAPSVEPDARRYTPRQRAWEADDIWSTMATCLVPNLEVIIVDRDGAVFTASVPEFAEWDYPQEFIDTAVPYGMSARAFDRALTRALELRRRLQPACDDQPRPGTLAPAQRQLCSRLSFWELRTCAGAELLWTLRRVPAFRVIDRYGRTFKFPASVLGLRFDPERGCADTPVLCLSSGLRHPFVAGAAADASGGRSVCVYGVEAAEQLAPTDQRRRSLLMLDAAVNTLYRAAHDRYGYCRISELGLRPVADDIEPEKGEVVVPWTHQREDDDDPAGI